MEFYIEKAAVLLILGFSTITFLQSGFDKIIDWKGNLDWLKGHFAESAFKNSVPYLLAIVLILEVTAGLLLTAGIFSYAIYEDTLFPFLGLSLAGTVILMLLLGQRIAKDYPGAFTLTGYFIIIVAGLFFLK